VLVACIIAISLPPERIVGSAISGNGTVIDRSSALVRPYLAYRPANSLLLIAPRSSAGIQNSRIVRNQEVKNDVASSYTNRTEF
jgi:hypothetical protein